MNKRPTTAVIAGFTLTALLCGCTYIGDRTLPRAAVTVTTTAETTAEPLLTKAPETSVTTTAPVTTTTAETEQETYELDSDEKKFIDTLFFVGDSICSGLYQYDILPKSQVCAKGNVGVRNISDFQFDSGSETSDIITILTDTKPKIVVFSMGMNDVNMTTKEEFCDNYKSLIAKAKIACPSAKYIVLGVTPVKSGSEFCTNAHIDEYNTALMKALKDVSDTCFIDAGILLKDENGALAAEYDSGEGIHLAPAAYPVILWEIANYAEWQ